MQEKSTTVIIPTLNEEMHISRLLKKLLEVPEIEVIVSDGESEDGTKAVCTSYPVKLISGLRGRGRQLNKGAQIAQGDILLFLHADSDFDEGIFNQIKGAVANGQSWGCCTLAFAENNLFFRSLAIVSGLRARIFSSCYGDQGLWCSKDFFNQVGGFPEFPFLEDLAFSHKAKKVAKALTVPGKVVTSTRRFRKNGLWLTLYRMQLAKILYYLGRTPEEILKRYDKPGRAI